MKKTIASIIGLFLLTVSLFSAEIMVAWDNNTNGPVSMTNTVYVSTNSFPDTNAIQVRVMGNESNAIIAVTTGPVYKLYVTAKVDLLESRPSNQIRYQRFNADIKRSTSITIGGATNWAGAILTKPPTNGILIGSPPFFMYTPTNTVAAVKDRFAFQISETWEESAITNYYSIHFQYPNQPPKIIDQIEVILP